MLDVEEPFRFSVIICFGSCCCLFSQSKEISPGTKPKAFTIDSFGKVTNGNFRSLLDSFLIDIQKRNDETRGIVVNFGSVRAIEARKRLVSNHIAFRKFNPSLISFVRGGNVSLLRTDLWIVPYGSDPPNIEREAYIGAEFGRVTKANLVRIVRNYFGELANNSTSQGYIINYGTNAEIALREKWITSALFTRKYDRSRITLVRGGRKGGVRTVMWIVPPGAANPKP